ncbi:MAG: hypothetical protein ACOCYN_00705 [Planctomycetota bacterium]
MLGVEAVLLVGAIEMWCEDQITAYPNLPEWTRVLFVMLLVAGLFGAVLLFLQRLAYGSMNRAHKVVDALPLPTPTLMVHALAIGALFVFYAWVLRIQPWAS